MRGKLTLLESELSKLEVLSRGWQKKLELKESTTL